MTVQYITNPDGQKVSVVLSIEEYSELLEDLEDLAAVAELRDEITIPWKQVKQELLEHDLL